jgi:hypothetical protein
MSSIGNGATRHLLTGVKANIVELVNVLNPLLKDLQSKPRLVMGFTNQLPRNAIFGERFRYDGKPASSRPPA